jgi:Zinc carboxypeptidase/Cytosolic carboxypeptidase N-terminal domain
MKRSGLAVLLGLAFILIFGVSCKKDKTETPLPNESVSADFEAGNIGELVKLSNTKWEFYLADDNDNPELPDAWRNWWYVKIANGYRGPISEINLKNRGWPYYYLPVYSNDNKEWLRMQESEVVQNEQNELILKKTIENKKLWMARFYPYTFTDLEAYLSTIDGNANVDVQVPGYSQDGKAIYVLKITNPDVPVSGKKRVFMHARTHPGETPPSFMLEGMVSFLLNDTPEANEILNAFEFYVFPMQNVDGVTVGNYRSTPLSENLEVMWYYDASNPLNLSSAAPQEVHIVHAYAKNLMLDGGPPVSMALNLHASNSEPDVRPFFYPHFGTQSQGYDLSEASLWEKQLSFIGSFAMHYGSEMIEPVADEGGSSFAAKTYPESWWWVNFQDQVMAMTMELTYGRAGYAPAWIVPDDLRKMGISLVRGIRDFYNPEIDASQFLVRRGRNEQPQYLKYPEFYPPDAVDEQKE